MLRTLGRAVDVLGLFTVERSEWGATAVAAELGLAKSQAHELLVSLAGGGLLRRVGGGRYQLGWRVTALNAVLMETSALLRLATPQMRGLVERYGEAVHLAVWDGRAVCVGARPGRLRTAVAPFSVGADLPMLRTAAGKVLLSGRPGDEIARVLTREQPATRAGSATKADLVQVAAQGFASELEEYRAGTCSVAAPVVDRAGGVRASLGMSVPVDRWKRGEVGYRRAVMAAAEHLARRSDELERGPWALSA
jgi:DNA-binding IclR family transcriptional regulator